MTDRLSRLILKRTHMRPDATLGELQTEAGERICYTLEEPWRDNKRRVSCIPEGCYRLQKHTSKRHGNCLLLLDVPGRSDIQIHAGNDLTDTEGCILVGNRRSYWSGAPVVLLSRAALSRLYVLVGDTATITIQRP